MERSIFLPKVGRGPNDLQRDFSAPKSTVFRQCSILVIDFCAMSLICTDRFLSAEFPKIYSNSQNFVSSHPHASVDANNLLLF